MWLLGSTSQVMMMDERLSPAARSVQSPSGENPSTIHSIEAILGFKEDTLFHKSASYGGTDKAAAIDAAERNVIVAPVKKSHSAESFDGERSFSPFCVRQLELEQNKLIKQAVKCRKMAFNF